MPSRAAIELTARCVPLCRTQGGVSLDYELQFRFSIPQSVDAVQRTDLTPSIATAVRPAIPREPVPSISRGASLAARQVKRSRVI